MEIYLIAFSIGLVGSMHCVGMCGPLSLALPIGTFETIRKISAISIYNLGRVITYSIIGLLLGLFGSGLALAGIQQVISIALGILLIAGVLLPFFNFIKKALPTNNKILKLIKSNISALFQKKTFTSFFLIGILNGLLPCGLVYVALSGAIALGNLKTGSLYMAAFGLGTIPAMFAVNFAGKYLMNKFKLNLNKAIPVFIIAIGCMMIIRGMNLGIPYLSPKADIKQNVVKSCCENEK